MNRNSPVLILTHTDDSHANIVEAALHERNVPVARLNSDEWPPCWEISFQIGPSSKSIELFFPSLGWMPLSSFRAIWHRRIVDPTLPVQLPSDELLLLLSEREEAFNALIRLFNGFILGNPFDYRRVDNKVLQIHLAVEQGLDVPLTLLTSSPKRAEEFVNKVPFAIYKLQRSLYISHGSETHAVYTHRIDDESLSRLNHVANSPSLFQNEISKAYELRVTVVGSKTFACKMDTQASPFTRLDYRKYDFENVSHEAYILPSEVEQKCVAFIRSANLFFASMDFICTPDNQYVFLDLNPNGQWLWTEELAGLPISSAIADLLTNPPQLQ